MPPWRLHSIADLAMPKGDNYDGNRLVAPHFAYTPELMPVDVVYEYHGLEDQVRKWKPIARELGREARALYRKHGLQAYNTTKAGLYLAGSNEDMKDPDRDRMMLLVFELEATDCHRWQAVDEDARALLEALDVLCDGDTGVCLRYYVRERRAVPNPRREALSANPVQDNMPPLSPLHDPYGEDHPSIRRMPRVHLPPNDPRHRPEVARRPVYTNPRAELALQRMSARYQADAAVFRTDSNDSLAPPHGESNQAVAEGRPRRRQEEKENEADWETESERELAALARRYSRLAERIDREHQYNIEAQSNDYRLFTRYLDTSATDWEDGSTVRDDDSQRWSDDDPDDQLQYQSDAEGDDERLQVRILPRIDRGGLPAARNRAVQYLRQMTRSDHDRHFGGRGM